MPIPEKYRDITATDLVSGDDFFIVQDNALKRVQSNAEFDRRVLTLPTNMIRFTSHIYTTVKQSQSKRTLGNTEKST